MKRTIAAVALIAASLFYFLNRPAPSPSQPAVAFEMETPPPPIAAASQAKSSATPTPAPKSRRIATSLSTRLNAPDSTAAEDVAVLHGMLRQYLRFLKNRQGRPIGNDSDLARVLIGNNPMKLVLLLPDHPALGADGRLRDRFGTPYFIHPRGNLAFEIRSAGPDRKLFTADDLIENPTPGANLAELPPETELPEQ